jgi:GT2 family glycosyltransferase
MRTDVSIVVPTYRRPELISRCVDALIDQDFHASYEIVVVSDGPDGSGVANTLYKKQLPPGVTLKYLELPAKKGPAAARNLGWRTSKGTLIIFTDDDCIPTGSFVKEHYDAYRRCPECVAFTGTLQVPISSQPSDYEKNISRLSTAEFVTANCSLDRAALEKAGGFDERFTMAWREDSDLHFNLIEKKIPVNRVPEAIVLHPVREAKWGVSAIDEKKNMFNALLLKKHPQLYNEKIHSRPPAMYYVMTILLVFSLLSLILFELKMLAWIPFLLWVMSLAAFTGLRMNGTRKTPSHISEMIVTSAIIPVLSIFWNGYGSLKFKKLLL